MKKSVKIILLSLLGLLIVVFILAMYVNFSGLPQYENKAPELAVEITEARVTEGARMAAFLTPEVDPSCLSKMLFFHQT